MYRNGGVNDTGSTEHYNLHKPEESERPDVSTFNANMDTIDTEMFTKAKSWNGILPGPDGNITATTIPFAENLTSSKRQVSEGEFIIRTAGGSASLGGGVGVLEKIQGNRVHTGQVPAVVELRTTFEPHGNVPAATANINRETFLAHPPDVSTVTLTYTTQWSADPPQASGTALEYYGVSVRGAAGNGDIIYIDYTPEDPGTIVQSSPTAFTATGWNLYNHNTGYARVVKYSETYGFKVSGTYDTIRFSEALDGERSTITPDVNGNFSISADGYVWVTGGNNTDTAIWATWSDWTSTYDGEFEPYTENTVSFTTLMENRFPYGLLRAGDIRDEIDFTTGQAYSKIERLENNSTNLAAARDSGREYEYDEEYIYLEKASYDVYGGVPVNNTFRSDDHGIEFISGTEVKVSAKTTYSTDLKNKLERDVLTISAQTLSEAQKAQVRENIGAAAPGETEEQGGGQGGQEITGPLFTWEVLYYQNLFVASKDYEFFRYNNVTQNLVSGYKGFALMGTALYGRFQGDEKDLVLTQAYYYPIGDSVRFVVSNHGVNDVHFDMYIYIVLVKENLFVDYV